MYEAHLQDKAETKLIKERTSDAVLIDWIIFGSLCWLVHVLLLDLVRWWCADLALHFFKSLEKLDVHTLPALGAISQAFRMMLYYISYNI